MIVLHEDSQSETIGVDLHTIDWIKRVQLFFPLRPPFKRLVGFVIKGGLMFFLRY